MSYSHVDRTFPLTIRSWIPARTARRHQALRMLVYLAVGVAGLVGVVDPVQAGMPTLLPSGWTADTPDSGDSNSVSLHSASAASKIQAISFFVAVFLTSALLIKWICNAARKDLPFLPLLSYGRSLALLMLWGLVFVVVLTMISGARELMTPGAWRKQGWTYTLNNKPVETAASMREQRQRGLEKLRTALWQYAGVNQGRLPNTNEPSIEAQLWSVPNHPGLRFMSADKEFTAEKLGRLYLFEPDIDDERLVLLTNGFIGTMSSREIHSALNAPGQNATPSDTEMSSTEGELE